MIVRAILLTVLLASGGCVRVAPWERGTLATQHMQSRPLPDADRQIMTVHELAEGLTFTGGGADGNGAGCGCN
jgi:hypothetical protein